MKINIYSIKYCLPYITCLFFFQFLVSCSNNSNKEKVKNTEKIQHGVVFSEKGKYGGWPANNGIWIWDNEILVGFVQADFQVVEGSMHTYDRSSARNKYARSKDGGQTWTIEDAFERGQTAKGADHNIAPTKAQTPTKLIKSIPDFTNPDFAMAFLRGDNDKGPSHFYYSNNRGERWEGPFEFPNLGTTGVATRTDYIIDGKQEMNVFLTVAKSNKEEGRVAMAKTTNSALNWELVSWVGPEPEGFDIMPSSVRLSPYELITTIRSRTKLGLDLITSYYSNDNGLTWEKLKDPVSDTGRGGSPPALVKLQDGRLALGYIYRSEHGSRVNVRFSSDNGKSWSDEIMLRGGDGANRDCGYPRMVQRPDGKIVMVYYWNNVNKEGATPYRYIAYTIFDPNQWS